MAESDNGSTDPTPHEKTFEAFVKVAAYVFVVVLLILVFLAIGGT